MSLSPEVDAYLERRRVRYGLARNETYAALALVLATVAALIWANVGSSYEQFWHIEAGIDVGGFRFELTLHEWVDEFLMALFFFVIGLDVRREISIGDLQSPSRALLPIAAAIGGLVVPACIFLLLNQGTAAAQAWGTVISTDTAFALGMLALIGPRNAPRLRLFLLAVAVVDDIGALLVIAVAYTSDLNLLAIAIAIAGLLGIYLLQRAGVWRTAPYLVAGLIVWSAVHESGIHATLAGVLIALLMPVYDTRRRDVGFVSEVFGLFRQSPSPVAARVLRETLVHAIPLNQRLTALLPPYVSFLIVPIFALANAGIVVSPETIGDALRSSLTWGIVAGLVLGKVIGVAGTALLVMRFLPSSRVPGLDPPRLLGIGALSGMGFTISLLVAGLALDEEGPLTEARLGILGASVIALLLATLTFRLGDRLAPLPEPDGERLPRPVDDQSDHVLGDVGAPVSLVVYAAINDEYRNGPAEALEQVVHARARQGQVRLVFRHHATTPSEMLAASALEAAARQGRFWEMHDALLQAPRELDLELVLQIADDVQVTSGWLRRRIEQGSDMSRVMHDTLDEIGEDAKDGTPVFYLQGTRIPSTQNAWHLARRLDEQSA